MQRSENYPSGVYIVAEILMLFIRGYMVMLTLGALSQPEHLDVPELAIGYVTSIILTIAASYLFNQTSARQVRAWTVITEEL